MIWGEDGLYTMTVSYDTYDLSRKEKWTFAVLGYTAIFAGVFLFFRSIPVSAAAGCSVYFLLPRYADSLAKSRKNELLGQFRDLLLVLSSSIESGHHMEESIMEASHSMRTIYPPDSPIMMELESMRKSLEENNASDVSLLTGFAERSCSEDIQDFVQVYLACRNTGGDIGKVIGHTSKIMTEKMEINNQIAVLTAQKKLEGRIISTMPIAMLLGLNILSPSYVTVLYTTPAGRLIMLLSMGGILTGMWLMEKLTDFRV